MPALVLAADIRSGCFSPRWISASRMLVSSSPTSSDAISSTSRDRIVDAGRVKATMTLPYPLPAGPEKLYGCHANIVNVRLVVLGSDGRVQGWRGRRFL